MDMKIKQVKPLTSQSGKGLDVGDVTINMALITEIELNEGEDLSNYMNGGLSLDYRVVKDDSGNGILDDLRLELPLNELGNARNYVIVATDKNNETSIVGTADDIVEIFKLPKEEAYNLDKYLPLLADSRNLTAVKYHDKSRNEDCFFFTPDFDNEVMCEVNEDDFETALKMVMDMNRNPQYKTELDTHNFGKMLLIALVKTGQDRYNVLNRDEKLAEAAKLLSEITYWNDGKMLTPSVADINAYANTIKEDIRIK